MTPDDRLIAVRAGRYQIQRNAADRLDTREVVLRGARKLAPARDAHRAFAPSRQRLVDRLALGEHFGAERQDVALRALTPIADAELHLLHAVEHVELGHAQP